MIEWTYKITYSVPFCLRIRNCSGERTARHSSSDFWADPGAAMATTPPRKPRFGWWMEMVRERVTKFDGEMRNWVLKREVGWEGRRFEKMGLVLIGEQRGVVLRILRPVVILLGTMLMCEWHSVNWAYDLEKNISHTRGGSDSEVIWCQ